MKILVRGANWIGDAVMTVPALRALRQLYPDANITLHTRAWAEGIFRDADFIDRILKIEYDGSGFRDVFREAKRVAVGKYDLAVLFTNSFQTAALVRLAGVPRRIGYSREGRGILLTDPIKPPAWRDEKHQSSYYLHLIIELARRNGTELSLDAYKSEERMPVSDERRAKARALLLENGLELSKPIVALGVGSTNSTAKRWGEERYAELSDMLARDLGANIILLGAQNEVDVSSRVASLAKADIIDLTGKTDLSAAAAILSEADLFISNDMGLAHLSSAVGTKTAVIFGPTNDVTTRPLGNKAWVIRHPVECSPCMLRECPIDHRCMTRIEPETVFQKAVELLNERPKT